MHSKEYKSFWIGTETYEALKVYIDMNDDVLTLPVHLGYLGFDETTSEVFIPNLEISNKFENAIDGKDWSEI